jgi:ABC-type antimicrobial peptide transport system permease subunit
MVSHLNMAMLRYVCVSVAGLLAGVAVGSVSGLSLGWLLALGHHGRAASDPGDAPVYMAMGLMLLGAFLGAVVGLVAGIIVSMRMSRRKPIYQSS